MKARDLFDLAQKVEIAIANLYEDISRHLDAGSDEARFFAHMAAQEHMHAAWAEELAARLVEDVEIASIHPEEFAHILATIEDVHDEVVHEQIDVCGALEIILHLENSTAENFYQHFPSNIPGLPMELLGRLGTSCDEHVQAVKVFQSRYACRLTQPDQVRG